VGDESYSFAGPIPDERDIGGEARRQRRIAGEHGAGIRDGATQGGGTKFDSEHHGQPPR
jgi:hypothetical protein